jgi:hypothetical protein
MQLHWKRVTMQRRWNGTTPWPAVGVVAALASAVAAAGGAGGDGRRPPGRSPAAIGPVRPGGRPAPRRSQSDVFGIPDGHASPPYSSGPQSA